MHKLPPHILVDNRSARFHYEILEEFEAGIVLTGKEVKSCRTGKPKLAGSFVSIDKSGEAWLRNLDIPEYKFAKGQPHERKRDRKLLLTQKELSKIQKSLNEKGITAMALDLHLKNRQIKAKIALGRGKKKWDKREAIKKRDVERDLKRGLKNL